MDGQGVTFIFFILIILIIKFPLLGIAKLIAVGTHLVKDDLDVVAERLKGRNDHPVLEGLRDEDDVLAQDRLEGLGIEPQVLEVGQG